MFKFLFKKEDHLLSLIYKYLETLQATRDNFAKAMNTCTGKAGCDQFDFLIERTHKYESKADDFYDEINDLMYGKALIPESRADVMGLLEMVETIPRVYERILFMIQTQKIVIPGPLMPDIQDLVRISLDCCDILVKQIKALLEKQQGIRTHMNTIDKNESHCDHVQRRIIVKIFDDDGIAPFDKLQLKEVIRRLGEISDRTLWVARRVNIMSMTRRV
ncbi:MAG: DUF47 family protein [Desulfobacterales bacterium]|nr:DUF47 family protein [Desulfobacterales bacterium]